jgi:hypothetical protein
MSNMLTGTQGGTRNDAKAGRMSYVAQKRQKLDKFIDQFDEKTSTGGSSNEVMAMMMMMDERALARQADHDQRERQFQLELALREDEREERRAARGSRQMEI